MAAREVDLAWAAGFFEGEGCVSRAARCPSLRLSLCSTDPAVLERFRSIVGCGRIYDRAQPTRPAHYKPIAVWVLSKQNDVQRVMAALLPHLGARRRARYAELVTARDEELAGRRNRLRHGVYRYGKGCRCDVCRAAHNAKLRRWRKSKAQRLVASGVNGAAYPVGDA